ncbi:hypothetical protein PENTCL1PPCAC_22510 [Pristionchus entomophagus]|uniref:C2H2-type domain-containing protein n=1 Tax=Pristionchus entomophagus TaxID=358040 RepID=A0AAV5U1E1_9BILA|nr:hypothetical protein PENTCL1PPCAC_22510 [Pristionchus entomophagus]
MDYPLTFKCVECTLDYPTLEQLESHIWRRHLDGFPFYCALCSWPALNENALTEHFYDKHPKKQVEFKRKIDLETKLRTYISQSICLQLYCHDSADELLYEDDPDQDGMGGMQALQPTAQQQFHMEDPSEHNVGRRGNRQDNELEVNKRWNEQANLKRINNGSEIIYMDAMGREQHHQDEMQGSIEAITEVEVEEMDMGVGDEGVDDMGIMESVMDGQHDDGDHHQQGYLYDQEELEYAEGDEVIDELEEEEYVDEQGNFFYNFHKQMGGQSDEHMRMMKNRHLDYIVGKVAEGQSDMGKKTITAEECNICGKVLKYPSRIAAHHRMHAEERIFRCEHCNKTFTQKSSLNVHLRKHTGEKPYSCQWECGKTFTSSSACRMHEKSHSGERKHSCSVCGQLFSKRSHVVRHEKNKHANVLLGERILSELVPTLQNKAAVDEVVESVHNEKMRDKMYTRQERSIMKREQEVSLHG